MNPDSNDEVARLLAAERDLPQPPPGAAERVLARVHGTIASPPVPPGAALGSPARPGLLAAAATTSVWLKLAAVLVVGAGGVTTYHLATRDAAPASTPEPVATTVAVPPEPLPVPPTAVVAPAPTPTPTPTPSAPTPPTPPPPATEPTVAAAAALPTPSDPSPTPPPVKVAPEPPARDPAAERKLLEAAQNALARSDGAAALQATKDHAKLFPRGALVEERLSLRVRALVMTGQRPAAEKTADELRRRFPNSIHLPAVEAVLGAQP